MIYLSLYHVDGVLKNDGSMRLFDEKTKRRLRRYGWVNFILLAIIFLYLLLEVV